MYQELTLIGYLGSNPELRTTQDGTPVCNFSVAVNRTWKDGAGTEHTSTTWYRATTWRRQAEICHQYLKQGSRVFLVANQIELVVRNDNNGTAQGRIEITPRIVRFLSPVDDTADEDESLAADA